MITLVHHLVETWPEILGGFIAYCTHSLKHVVYHGVTHLLKGRPHAEGH